MVERQCYVKLPTYIEVPFRSYERGIEGRRVYRLDPERPGDKLLMTEDAKPMDPRPVDPALVAVANHTPDVLIDALSGDVEDWSRSRILDTRDGTLHG